MSISRKPKNGKVGLNYAINNNLDVIISDIDMPVMDGIEFCRELKSRPETRGIPVIVVSAFDSEEDVNRGFQAGATDYIPKEHAKEQLCEKVQEIIRKVSFQRQQVIMVVDDSETIRHVVQSGLEKSGYQTITAENGKQAIDLLGQTSNRI